MSDRMAAEIRIGGKAPPQRGPGPLRGHLRIQRFAGMGRLAVRPCQRPGLDAVPRGENTFICMTIRFHGENSTTWKSFCGNTGSPSTGFQKGNTSTTRSV